MVLQLWGALRLGAVVLRRRYHALRGELYRPAWEPQDYEMVELFLRRLRLWMGFSKVKEVSAEEPLAGGTLREEGALVGIDSQFSILAQLLTFYIIKVILCLTSCQSSSKSPGLDWAD